MKFLRRWKRLREAPNLQSLHWNQASALDALAALGENARLANQLDESRHSTLMLAIKSLESNIKSLTVPEIEPVTTPVEVFDPTPKRLEFALACHLVAARGGSPAKVVDVGAHRGVFSKMIREVGAHVWALEPNPKLCEELIDRFSEDKNVKCLPFALCEQTGRAELHTVVSDDKSAQDLDLSLFSALNTHPLPSPLRFESSFKVETRTIDSLIADGSLPPDFFLLKIDTEGAEFSVLKGMSTASPDIICLEYWSDDVGFRSEDIPPVSTIIEEMSARGYPYHLTLFQTPEMSWPTWELGFSNGSRSYGNLFFFQESAPFQIATQWCHHLLDPLCPLKQ